MANVSFPVHESSHFGMYTGLYSSNRSDVLKWPTPNGVMKRNSSMVGWKPEPDSLRAIPR